MLAATLLWVLFSVCAALAFEPGSFTLLVYMNGSDLESRHGLATANLQDMLKSVPLDDKFNAVLFSGGTKHWKNDLGIEDDSITYVQITKNGFQKNVSLQKQPIGDSLTLANFISYAMKAFPAERYGLIFWNHGAGSVRGFGYDEWFPDDHLTAKELRGGLQSALKDSTRFAFVGFDACLMSAMEIAVAVSPFADYMVASQELEPGEGWNYQQLFDTLRKNPGLDTDKLGKQIVNAFVSAGKKKSLEQRTLSLVNLSKIPMAADAIGVISEKLQRNGFGDSLYQKVSKSRLGTNVFGKPSLIYNGLDMVDAIDLLNHFKKENLCGAECDSAKLRIKEAVVYAQKSDTSIIANGLSIYFPYFNKTIAGNLNDYNQSGFNKSYISVIDSFANKLLQGSQKKIDIIQKNDSILKLSAKTILNTPTIYNVLLSSESDGSSLVLGFNNTFRLTQSLTINTSFDGQWLTINGIVPSIYKMPNSDSKTTQYSIPALLSGERVDLFVSYDVKKRSGELKKQARRVATGTMPDKGYVQIESGDSITFLYAVFDTTGGEVEYRQGKTLIMPASTAAPLEIKEEKIPNGKYLYGFCLVDLYQKKNYTEFKNINIGNL
ncbi:hypothetical protein AGMMS49938_00740 [Fibrobacterales bacterium]|nr:hypothetical protein AGMMS49938_00740 [Fibrobacterales bacterium]